VNNVPAVTISTVDVSHQQCTCNYEPWQRRCFKYTSCKYEYNTVEYEYIDYEYFILEYEYITLNEEHSILE